MTIRKPLVIIDGAVHELPDSDLLYSAVPNPDNIDQTGSEYFYFGWININSNWLIQRQNRSDGNSQSCTTGYDTLVNAWSNRVTLEYT